MRPTAATFVALALVSCGGVTAESAGAGETPETPPEETPALPDDPYVLVLGTAQDASIPQIASTSANSEAARSDPSLRRLVASLLVVDPRSGSRWLIDATPDIRAQVDLADDHPAWRPRAEGRPPLFEAIFLTHAHMGHYAGLLQLGREAYAAERQPVHCSAVMCEMLRASQPFRLLVDLEHITVVPFTTDQPAHLADDLTLTPIVVPHRAEISDTHGFVIRGPNASLLYIPDIDKWDTWERRIEDLIADVDVALLDGTFYADGEIGGRSMAEIPHPFIEESMTRFAALPPSERQKIFFTHLNHTNPAANPASEAARTVARAEMRIAREGQIFAL